MSQRANLKWESSDKGILFRLLDSGGINIAPNTWGLHEVTVDTDQQGSIGPIIGLVEDGAISIDENHEVLLPHSIVASMSEQQAAQIGLPPSSPVRLSIKGQGILTSPNFRFQYQLVKTNGSPIMGIKRNGSLLEMGGSKFLLLDPLYSLVEGMEAFNNTPPDNMDDRMLRWADLKPLLPEDALVANNLKSMNIVRADSFTLDIDDAGEFSPQLLHKPQKVKNEDSLEEPKTSQAVLPGAAQRDFNNRFRRQPKARRHYTTAGNWFVVVPKHLHRALDVVREKQDATYVEKRAFIANPTAILKERLQEELPEEEIEQFFEETPEFLSDRVSQLGVWEPKQNTYILPSGQKWLPFSTGGFGVLVEDAIYNIAPSDIDDVFKELLEAKEQGLSHVQYKGQEIPVNEAAIEALGRLESGSESSRLDQSDQVEQELEDPSLPSKPLVPILIDNVEELGFQKTKRKIRGATGGIPAVLKTVSLYPHQEEGLKWLQEHWASGSTGALLADDMGLGKTLQTLAFLAWVQEQMDTEHHSRKPMLIVAPTGLLKNWEDEATIHLFSPGLGSLYRAYGSNLGALKSLSHNQRKEKLESSDWTLTTYEALRDKIRYFLPINWGVIVFDEVQKIKNPASRLTEMAKSVEADFFLALTGTPVENRLGDLWSIIDTVAPGALSSLSDFHKRYEQDSVSKLEAIGELRTALTETPEPIRLLRRLKIDHLKGLPKKSEHLIEVQMSQVQASAYDEVIAPARGGGLDRGSILGILQRMRKVSLLPDILDDKGITDEVIDSSARLSALIKILDDIKNKNEKVLIFLEFLTIQEALMPYLQNRYQLSKPPMRISSEVPGHIRKKHVDEFQNRPRDEFDIMILSPKAGGVGLTLTAANNVIHLSRWWNPAVEDQCTDRVFRIGQERSVDVYIPLAIHPRLGKSSFDMNLNSLLERKRALSRELLTPPVARQSELDELLTASV